MVISQEVRIQPKEVNQTLQLTENQSMKELLKTSQNYF